ncbi:MAG: amidohydrolase family protein [Deltaproteobacteria bacterium]|nr:amidohydrolase family protein [Deltaproteobacteria bacterium]
MALLTRRRALYGLGGLSLGLLGARCALPGWLRHGPPRALEGEVAAEVERLFADVDRSKLWDLHVHLVGRGVGTKAFVGRELTSRLSPWKNLQYEIYAAAAGLSTDADTPDRAYLDRLLALHRLGNPQGKLVLLAFDQFVDETGQERPEHSELFTPNEYVLEVARENPDVVACASVHPYRKDALARLEGALDAGARMVKWLPNAMGIDPRDPRCGPFYRVLAERRVPLLTHTGEEQAVDAKEAQAFGNPTRLWPALDAGVTVIAAHLATTGACLDEAATMEAAHEGAGPSCFSVLRDMLRDPRTEGRLYTDLSATLQVNRAGAFLAQILADTALHPRLVNGSDYPLPAIDPLVSTRYLVRAGLLAEEDRALCNIVFAHNPLLFDYVLKRKVRVVLEGQERRFPPSVFETAGLFDGARA